MADQPELRFDEENGTNDFVFSNGEYEENL